MVICNRGSLPRESHGLLQSFIVACFYQGMPLAGEMSSVHDPPILPLALVLGYNQYFADCQNPETLRSLACDGFLCLGGTPPTSCLCRLQELQWRHQCPAVVPLFRMSDD
jgi:hypothetical protein